MPSNIFNALIKTKMLKIVKNIENSLSIIVLEINWKLISLIIKLLSINTEEIISELNLISNDLNLQLLVIDSSLVDINKYQDNLASARIIVSMHGGANYNLVFADKNCLFFEFVPIQNTGSTIDFISGLGIRYIPVPLNFSFAENNIHVSNKVIKEIGLIAKELLLTIS